MQEDGEPEEAWAAHAVNKTLPAGMDPAAATMMITWRETHSYISRLGVKGGDAVLVLGSGGNGFSFAVMACALGAGHVAMLGNPHWAQLAERAGVASFADYRDPAAYETLRIGAPGGYDFIIDAVGRTGGLEGAAALLKPEGKVGLYGIEDLGERMGYLQQLAKQGVEAHGPGEYSEAEAHEAVVALVEAGALDAGIWFDPHAATPLDDIGEAIAAIEARKSLKAVVQLSA